MIRYGRPKRIVRTMCFAACALSFGTAYGNTEECEKRLDAEGYFCTEVGRTLLVGNDRAVLEIAERQVRDGSREFRKHFGREPKAAVVLMPIDMKNPSLAMSSEMRQALTLDRGFVLPWIYAPSFETKTKDRWFDALTHELGHVWFSQKYGGSDTNQVSQMAHYGLPGIPDWLDEVAAEAAETGAFGEEEMRQAKTHSDKSLPLTEFFAMRHPSLVSGTLMQEIQSGVELKGIEAKTPGLEIVQVEVDENDPRLVVETVFYAQTHLFLAFLRGQADSKALGSLAEHFRKDGEIEGWLSTQSFGLPKTLPGLQKAWDAWLSRQAGS